MKTLALDIGKTIAACTNIEGWEPNHRLYEGDRRERAAKVMCAMNKLCRELKPLGLEVVVYEDTFVRGITACKALYGIIGIIEACFGNAGFTPMGVSPATVKVFATGKGNATKEEMIAAAQIMGYEGDNEHEADAYCLLKYAEANVVTETKEEPDAQDPASGADPRGNKHGPQSSAGAGAGGSEAAG
jgi:Holliday junction resolvasome RuvABC endonuclease subunit